MDQITTPHLVFFHIPKRSFLPVQPVSQCGNAFLSRGIAISVNFVASGTLSFGSLAYSQNGIFSTFVCFGHNHFATNLQPLEIADRKKLIMLEVK